MSCLSQIQSPTAVSDDQVETKSTTALNNDNPDIEGEVEDDVLVDADVTIAVNNVQDLLAAAVDVDMLGDHSHNFEATAPVLGTAINAGKDDQMEGGLEGEIGPELDLKEKGVGVDLFEFMLDNNKPKRLIHHNLHYLSVSAAKNMILE